MVEVKQSQELAVHTLRARYQSMLDRAQEALEIQTCAAREQIDRLEDLLRQAHMQVSLIALFVTFLLLMPFRAGLYFTYGA
jgi:hypothetical protein